jgi:hypothetical protein
MFIVFIYMRDISYFKKIKYKKKNSFFQMNRFAIAILLVFSAAVFASDVIDLTPDNFDSVIDGSKAALVEV